MRVTDLVSLLDKNLPSPALTHYFQTCDAFIPEPRGIEYARQKNHMLVDSFYHFVQTVWSGKRFAINELSSVWRC